jgi:hypothetical protein
MTELILKTADDFAEQFKIDKLLTKNLRKSL